MVLLKYTMIAVCKKSTFIVMIYNDITFHLKKLNIDLLILTSRIIINSISDVDISSLICMQERSCKTSMLIFVRFSTLHFTCVKARMVFSVFKRKFTNQTPLGSHFDIVFISLRRTTFSTTTIKYFAALYRSKCACLNTLHSFITS